MHIERLHIYWFSDALNSRSISLDLARVVALPLDLFVLLSRVCEAVRLTRFSTQNSRIHCWSETYELMRQHVAVTEVHSYDINSVRIVLGKTGRLFLMA